MELRSDAHAITVSCNHKKLVLRNPSSLCLVQSSQGRGQQRQQRRRRSRCRGLLRHTDCYSGQVSGGREAVVGAALPIVVAGWLLSGVRLN